MIINSIKIFVLNNSQFMIIYNYIHYELKKKKKSKKDHLIKILMTKLQKCFVTLMR